MTLYFAHLDVCYHARSLMEAESIADAIVSALQARTDLVHEADVMHVDIVDQKLVEGRV